jgi:hypothetical protein
MAEIVADAADAPVGEGVIADAAGAVGGLAAVDGIAVDAAGRVGEGTSPLPRICADTKKATTRVVAFMIPDLWGGHCILFKGNRSLRQ